MESKTMYAVFYRAKTETRVHYDSMWEDSADADACVRIEHMKNPSLVYFTAVVLIPVEPMAGQRIAC